MRGWTDDELEAAVLAYRQMVDAELGGQPYTKAEIRRATLANSLRGRSPGSFERRMQNISRVLGDLGLPWVRGYLPASHVGASVAERIERLVLGLWADDEVLRGEGRTQALVRSTPLGVSTVETFETSRQDATAATRYEDQLVKRFGGYLEHHGSQVSSHRYLVDDTVLFCDLFNDSRQQLVEAKASPTREHARMAVGQLLDYRRFEVNAVGLAALFPTRPDTSVLAYLHDVGVAAIWETQGRSYQDSVGGSFC